MQYSVGEETPSGKIVPLATADLPSVASAVARGLCEYYGRTVIVTDSKNKDALVARFTVQDARPARLHVAVKSGAPEGLAAVV